MLQSLLPAGHKDKALGSVGPLFVHRRLYICTRTCMLQVRVSSKRVSMFVLAVKTYELLRQSLSHMCTASHI